MTSKSSKKGKGKGKGKQPTRKKERAKPLPTGKLPVAFAVDDRSASSTRVMAVAASAYGEGEVIARFPLELALSDALAAATLSTKKAVSS